MSDGFMYGGITVKRNIPRDESSILEDFNENIRVKLNGQEIDPNQFLYEEQKNERIQNEPPQTPVGIEPGQIDPEEFFKSSLKGLF